MLYRFDECLLDTEERTLRRAGELLPLEPLVFDLIEFLIRNRGVVVSKNAHTTTLPKNTAIGL